MADLGYGINPLTIDQFVMGAHRHHDHIVRTGVRVDYRIGQAYSNYLAHHRPELHRRVIATRCDPYYTDANVANLIGWLVETKALR